MQAKAIEQEHPQHDWAQYTNMSVGEILRRTRAYYNLRLEDVEGALRIRAVQLAAIEDGQIEKLPGRVYAIGFVRAYSEFLGLDGDKMVHLFKAQMVGHKPRPELNFPAPASESKVPNPYILLASFAGFVLIVGIIALITGPKKDTYEIPEVQQALNQPVGIYGPGAPAMTSVTAPVTAMAPTAEMLAAIAPAAGVEGPVVPENRIVINVIDSAWVEIRNAEGKALLSRILKTGDSYMVPNEQGLVMDTGNIGALEFAVDGRAPIKLGAVGDVRRGVSLDPAQLKPVELLAPAQKSSSAQAPAATTTAAVTPAAATAQPKPATTPAAKPATATAKPAATTTTTTAKPAKPVTTPSKTTTAKKTATTTTASSSSKTGKPATYTRQQDSRTQSRYDAAYRE